MSVDIASLTVAVDATQVSTGVGSLQTLAVEAAKTEAAVQRLANTFGGFVAAAQDVASRAQAQADAIADWRRAQAARARRCRRWWISLAGRRLEANLRPRSSINRKR